MKKWLIITGAIGIILLIIAINSKFYYPALPIDTMSKKEVIDSLQFKDMIKIGTDLENEWYMTKMDQRMAKNKIKDMIQEEEWKFRNYDGNGLFFEKKNQTLIASTQMWTGNYVLVNVPVAWKK
ncbi:hypothetical protein [Bacillus mesophilum]|uniref:Uncharacterized protein n=1 Tax=Bacillus mesophilum TaxID=1071718 RepID=A0A7V7RQB4_9BACI|nr:hypothetical protein [Bacillus mesophilum]KAB2335598.1 hypothetical protein F7732_03225 [Bacillus mesophilum]